MKKIDKIYKVYESLAKQMADMRYSNPIAYVYNPLSYSFYSFKFYLSHINFNAPLNLFLGINPGPYGMAQTGIPFGDKETVKEYLKLDQIIYTNLPKQHPKKPLLGLDTTRVEVSGKRIWGLVKKLYPQKENFFKRNLILNCVPSCFLDENGVNLTPDKMKKEERGNLYKICFSALKEVFSILKIDKIIAIGNLAEEILKDFKADYKFIKITHPSPLNPRAVNWINDHIEFFEKNILK